jgi:hypothetical protein
MASYASATMIAAPAESAEKDQRRVHQRDRLWTLSRYEHARGV